MSLRLSAVRTVGDFLYEITYSANRRARSLGGGRVASERKRAFCGGQNSTLKKAVSEERRGKSASFIYIYVKGGCLCVAANHSQPGLCWAKVY